MAHKILESAQGPLVLALGLWFGPGLDNIELQNQLHVPVSDVKGSRGKKFPSSRRFIVKCRHNLYPAKSLFEHDFTITLNLNFPA